MPVVNTFTADRVADLNRCLHEDGKSNIEKTAPFN